MRRGWLLIMLLGLVAVATVFPVSGASFTSSSSSHVRVSTDSIGNWLHLYSQGTDPDGLTGYYPHEPSGFPAATGADLSLAVDLGTYATGEKITCERVFTIEAADSFPAGGTITVAATPVADPVTGMQPITAVGFAKVGNSNGTPNPVDLTPGAKRQVNMRLRLKVGNMVYRPRILITVTYPGMSASYYQYSVPVTVAAGF